MVAEFKEILGFVGECVVKVIMGKSCAVKRKLLLEHGALHMKPIASYHYF